LGWLEKEPLKNHYINWIGNIYKEKIVDKKWRDYFFWQPYTEIQMDSLVELCKDLSKKMSINLTCVGHNTKTNRMETFDGIFTRSNFDENYTDVSPAFDFEYFIKKLENE
jgi:N-acetyl-anhydromuramyl-L-alanine amidase AmpD